MIETVAVQSPVAASTSRKKVKQTAVFRIRKAAKPNSPHPPTSEMVNAAIAALKDRKGSSLQAIKKYMAETYKIDVKKQSVFIRKYLKSAVEKKTIVQAKGTGASGRFKLVSEAEKKVVKKPTMKKPVAKITAKKPTGKKATVEKPAAKKQTSAKKITVKSTPKSPSKAKKTGKAPAVRPKTPNPKKVVALKSKAIKK